MGRDPDNPRYPWFYGYAAFLQGEQNEARKWLQKAAESSNPWFPVERLNARMVLAAEAASSGEITLARQHLRRAKALFTQENTDFEVAVNRVMAPWLEEAVRLIDTTQPHRIDLPRFAC